MVYRRDPFPNSKLQRGNSVFLSMVLLFAVAPLESQEQTRSFDIVITNGRIIVNGGVDLAKKPVWIEGPHIFKRNGFYYLCAAEGGTSVNHSQVIFRTKSLAEPFVTGC